MNAREIFLHEKNIIQFENEKFTIEKEIKVANHVYEYWFNIYTYFTNTDNSITDPLARTLLQTLPYFPNENRNEIIQRIGVKQYEAAAHIDHLKEKLNKTNTFLENERTLFNFHKQNIKMTASLEFKENTQLFTRKKDTYEKIQSAIVVELAKLKIEKERALGMVALLTDEFKKIPTTAIPSPNELGLLDNLSLARNAYTNALQKADSLTVLHHKNHEAFQKYAFKHQQTCDNLIQIITDINLEPHVVPQQLISPPFSTTQPDPISTDDIEDDSDADYQNFINGLLINEPEDLPAPMIPANPEPCIEPSTRLSNSWTTVFNNMQKTEEDKAALANNHFISRITR